MGTFLRHSVYVYLFTINGSVQLHLPKFTKISPCYGSSCNINNLLTDGSIVFSYFPMWLVRRTRLRAEKWLDSSNSSSNACHRQSVTTSSRKRNSVAVEPTSRWTSCPSWNDSLTRLIIRTPLWGKSWVRDLDSLRLAFRYESSSSSPSLPFSGSKLHIRRCCDHIYATCNIRRPTSINDTITCQTAWCHSVNIV